MQEVDQLQQVQKLTYYERLYWWSFNKIADEVKPYWPFLFYHVYRMTLYDISDLVSRFISGVFIVIVINEVLEQGPLLTLRDISAFINTKKYFDIDLGFLSIAVLLVYLIFWKTNKRFLSGFDLYRDFRDELFKRRDDHLKANADKEFVNMFILEKPIGRKNNDIADPRSWIVDFNMGFWANDKDMFDGVDFEKRGTGLVYLLQDVGTNAVKIGVTINLKSRISSLTTGSATELKLIAAFEVDRPLRLEKYLHARYSDYRIRGEWFEIPQDVLDDLVEELGGNSLYFETIKADQIAEQEAAT